MKNLVKLATAYYRLSDEEKKRGESSSILNQRQIVESYCNRCGIIIVQEFVDDGYSGGNFDRPGFQRMLKYLEQGKANMVITKDLSRLGRDMSESSYYAERYFPEHAIHYIAPEDNFDSDSVNMMAPFQFAMNDVYLRDTSRKVKSVLDMKRKSGKYACCPPYGYKKATGTTDQLVPDENTAPVVRRIFALASAGESTRSIAKTLNLDGVIPPLKYRVECRDKFSERGASHVSDLWNYTTVKRILRNKVYLGHTILGKSRKVSVKSKVKLPVPEDEWYVTFNTHEPLVTQEQFDLAEHFLSENTKANGKNPAFRHSIFGGIAYCAHCGAAMCSGGSVYKGEREKYWYLVCNNLTSRSTDRCEKGARIHYYDLLEIVRRDLNRLIGFSDEEIIEITESAVKRARDESGEDDVPGELKRIEKQLDNLQRMIERAYRDNISGLLGDAQLELMVTKFTAEIQSLEKRQLSLRCNESESAKVKDNYDEFFCLARKYKHIDELDRNILHTFVERIEIGRKILPEGRKAASHRNTNFSQSIRIYYRFIGELPASSEQAVEHVSNF